MNIEIEGDLMEGVFVKRINRFIAHIFIEGEIREAHVANTGRMRELLVEGAKVIVRKVNKINRKTNYDLVMVYKDGILVLIDSKMPNLLLEKAFKEGSLNDFGNYDYIKREITYGNSRFDIGLSNREENALIECKCVTLVKHNRLASFPDAPTERGRKHVHELIRAKGQGYRTAVFFVIQREDADTFTPNRIMDPEFADAIKEAYSKGVEIYAYTCSVSLKEIRMEHKIPVIIN